MSEREIAKLVQEVFGPDSIWSGMRPNYMFLARIGPDIPIMGWVHWIQPVRKTEQVVFPMKRKRKGSIINTVFYFVDGVGQDCHPAQRKFFSGNHLDLHRGTEELRRKFGVPLRITEVQLPYWIGTRKPYVGVVWRLLLVRPEDWAKLGRNFTIVADTHYIGERGKIEFKLNRHVFPKNREVSNPEDSSFLLSSPPIGLTLLSMDTHGFEYITENGIHVFDMRKGRAQRLVLALDLRPDRHLRKLIEHPSGKKDRDLALDSITRYSNEIAPDVILYGTQVSKESSKYAARTHKASDDCPLPNNRLLQLFDPRRVVIKDN